MTSKNMHLNAQSDSDMVNPKSEVESPMQIEAWVDSCRDSPEQEYLSHIGCMDL